MRWFFIVFFKVFISVECGNLELFAVWATIVTCLCTDWNLWTLVWKWDCVAISEGYFKLISNIIIFRCKIHGEWKFITGHLMIRMNSGMKNWEGNVEVWIVMMVNFLYLWRFTKWCLYQQVVRRYRMGLKIIYYNQRKWWMMECFMRIVMK